MRGDVFSGSLGGGTCVNGVAGGGPIYFTQWNSNFKMRNAMAMLHQCYASAIDSSGQISTFSIMPNATSKTVFQPLEQFGFYPAC
ncbi:MAG: hypothetical protein ACKOI2_09825 [Actinomycetota bacterium]